MLLGVPSVNPAGDPFLFRDILSSPAAIFIVHAGPSHPSIFPSLSLCSATPSIIFALAERTNRTATCSFVFDELLSRISYLSWRYFLCSIISDKRVYLPSTYLSSFSLRFCRSLIKKKNKEKREKFLRIIGISADASFTSEYTPVRWRLGGPVNSATFERVPRKRLDISRKLPLWPRQYAKRSPGC